MRRQRPAKPKERLILGPAERKAALLGVISAAKRRVILSLFRCDDFSVLDALAAALDRGCEVEAVLTKRAKGGKKRLKKLWGALEEMGAVVTRFADPVVKYHAKYLVADNSTAMI
ncbi:MAG: phospholipase D-like domain-containing protein, partial [Vicinamibacterales bacterium]